MESRLEFITDELWEALAHEAGYRVSALAIRVYVSPQHLGLVIRQRFGLSPKAWLDRLMVRDALKHLRNGERVKDFYAKLGFSHPNDFSRAFRRLTRRQPKAARALATVLSPVSNPRLPSPVFRIAPKHSKKLRNLLKS